MDFDDLMTDVDLECPNCNRKFQQKGKELRGRPSIECPTCGEPVEIGEPASESTER